jgi:hypothetical protein
MDVTRGYALGSSRAGNPAPASFLTTAGLHGRERRVLTRENYIDANWPDGFGDEGWGWELEEQLPRPFQADYEPDEGAA